MRSFPPSIWLKLLTTTANLCILPFGLVTLGTLVDLQSLLCFWRCMVLDGRLKRWSFAALRFSGPEGYLHCGSDVNWAGLGTLGTLSQCTGYLRERTGAGLQ